MPSDAELTPAQRAAAIERAADNLALRSGAGCGKTFVLARRYVELLRRSAQGDQAMSHLVALTFTEKAALEMSTRVRQMLRDFAASAGGADRARLLAWLDELPEARISTIHGFCAALLRSHAIEAGVDPDFAVCADEFLVDQLIADAAERAVLEAVERQEGGAAELLAALSFEEVAGLVQELVEKRTGWRQADYAGPAATVERWRRLAADVRTAEMGRLAADEAIAREVDALEAFACRDPNDRLLAFRDEQLAVIRRILREPATATAAMFAELNPSPGNIGGAKGWGKEAVREVRSGLRELIRTVREYALFTEAPGDSDIRAAAALAALTGLAGRAEALYAAEKRRRGMLDFVDLLDRTERLLATSPAARKALAGGIDQLLMDEGQDTDGFQLRMLGRLIRDDGEDAGPPAPGKLFLVGDDKQSIYRFRGAQVEEFRRACEQLGKANQESLDTSFRTHEAGVAFINELFGSMMGAGYEPIAACRKETPPGASVEILLATDREGKPPEDAAGSSQAQAAVTAQRIAGMIESAERIVWDRAAKTWRAVRAGDVAILFARMTNSLLYERELQLRGVPYHVVAGTGFFQQQEVFDVLNALAAVDNPHDDIALFGALRSSLFGLDDNALMHVAESCRPPYFASLGAADLWRRLRGDQAVALAAAADLIGRLHGVKDAVGMDVLLDRLLEATGYEATLLSQFQGRRMAGNVRALIDRARAAAGQRMALADFIAQMRQQVASESRQEQAAVAGEQEDVVRIMTIHKAKGLEFPVVFVPDLNAGRRGFAGRCLLRSDWGLTLSGGATEDDGQSQGDGDRPDSSEGPLSFRLAKLLEDRDQQAEDVRRLYVAATRHEDHLVLVGADWRNADGRLRASDSYLARMDKVLGLTAAPGASGEIRYGEGRFAATVRSVPAGPPRRSAAAPPPGEKMLAASGCGADLADRLIAAAGRAAPPPLVGPLPPQRGRVEIAVTALGDFAQCPMLYRWRHELRLPRPFEAASPNGDLAESQDAAVALDAATIGTLFHRCMELLDFAAPQDAAALLRQAAAEMELEDLPTLGALAAELRAILGRFLRHDLAVLISAGRQVLKELAFTWHCGPAILQGQIDLLFQDRTGAWHVADYKSDRVAGGEDIARHAASYELQLLLYAAASARRLGSRPAGAVVYFLRPAKAVAFDVDERSIAKAEARAGQLATELIQSRRAGLFLPRRGQLCSVCSYRTLCQQALATAPAAKAAGRLG